MALTQINNGDTGLVARGKINDSFAEVDNLASTSWSPIMTIDTTDDTKTTVYSWTIQSPGTQTGFNAMTVKATVVGYQPNYGGKAYGAELFATFFAQNGTASYQVGTTDVIEKSSFSTATSHIELAGDGTISLTVTGETASYIKWNAEFRTMMTDYID
jgi:hypothetical protein